MMEDVAKYFTKRISSHRLNNANNDIITLAFECSHQLLKFVLTEPISLKETLTSFPNPFLRASLFK